MKIAKKLSAALLTVLAAFAFVTALTACGSEAALSSISVTTPPTKTEYNVGDTFDPAGMVVTAEYSDGTTKTITDYTVTPSGALTASNTSVRISYTENDVTKMAVVEITVKDENSGSGEMDPDAEGIAYQLTGSFPDLASYRIYYDVLMNLYNNGTVVAYGYNYLTGGDVSELSTGTWTQSSLLGATNINISYVTPKELSESAPIAADGTLSCSVNIPIGSGRSVGMHGSAEIQFDTTEDFKTYCIEVLHPAEEQA